MRKGFPFNAAEWLASADIALLRADEEGGYIRLLCYAWQSDDCGLPNDDDVLAELSRLNMDREWHNGAGSRIKALFRVEGDRIISDYLLRAKRSNVAKKREA